MKRLLLFISIFLGTALLIGGSVYWLHRGALDTVFENRRALSEGSEWVELTFSLGGVTDYIAQHPDRVSIYRHLAGELEPQLAYQADERRALGQLTGLHVLLALAHAFEDQTLNPDEPVTWEAIEKHQLPGWGAIEMDTAKRMARHNGWTPTLSELPRLWAASNSPAIHDYLLHRLGHATIRSMMDRLHLAETDAPLPFSGIMLTLSPVIQQMDAAMIYNHWSEQPRAEFEEEVWTNSDTFAYGDRRDAWTERIRSSRLGLDFFEQRDRLSLFPASTARETGELLLKLAQPMEEQVEGSARLTEPVRKQVLGWMERTLPADPPSRLSSYHGLFDHRIGLLSGVDLGVHAQTGESTIQVSLFDQLQIAVWFHLSSNHMHQYIHRQMLEEPRLVRDLELQLQHRAS